MSHVRISHNCQKVLHDMVDNYYQKKIDRKGCWAIGLVHIQTLKIDAITVFSPVATDDDDKPLFMEAKFLSFDKRVFTRDNLEIIFSYPFIHVGVKRLETFAPLSDQKIQKFNKQVGFRVEGILKNRHSDGSDLTINAMLKDECKWIDHGLYEAKNPCTA